MPEPRTDAFVAHPRGIRSYVKRGGRLTTGQARALQELGPCYLLAHDPAISDLADHLKKTVDLHGKPPAKIFLEIGFGMGETTAHMASLLPHDLIIGCEVHEPGVGALLKLMKALQLDNIRIIAHDAVQVLRDMIAPDSLDGIRVFFPDPWHKKRHHKRRLIQPDFVHELSQRLKPGACLHLATDWLPYAEHMLEVLRCESLLENTAPAYAPRPACRPLTKFELRGLKRGHEVRDLVFRKI